MRGGSADVAVRSGGCLGDEPDEEDLVDVTMDWGVDATTDCVVLLRIKLGRSTLRLAGTTRGELVSVWGRLKKIPRPMPTATSTVVTDSATRGRRRRCAPADRVVCSDVGVSSGMGVSPDQRLAAALAQSPDPESSC